MSKTTAATPWPANALRISSRSNRGSGGGAGSTRVRAWPIHSMATPTACRAAATRSAPPGAAQQQRAGADQAQRIDPQVTADQPCLRRTGTRSSSTSRSGPMLSGAPTAPRPRRLSESWSALTDGSAAAASASGTTTASHPPGSVEIPERRLPCSARRRCPSSPSRMAVPSSPAQRVMPRNRHRAAAGGDRAADHPPQHRAHHHAVGQTGVTSVCRR